MNKKVIIIVIPILLILAYLGRQAYYYRAYDSELIQERVIPIVLKTENKTYENNLTVGNISVDTLQLKEGEFKCASNRCENGEFVMMFNEVENLKLRGEYFFFSPIQNENHFKYKLKDAEINKYLEDINVNYLNELQLHYLNSEYQEVNFFSRVSDIKLAVVNNGLRSIIEPTVLKTFIIDDNIIVYHVTDKAYSIEWADKEKAASIMFKSDAALTQEQLLNFIDSIEYTK